MAQAIASSIAAVSADNVGNRSRTLSPDQDAVYSRDSIKELDESAGGPVGEMHERLAIIYGVSSEYSGPALPMSKAHKIEALASSVFGYFCLLVTVGAIGSVLM